MDNTKENIRAILKELEVKNSFIDSLRKYFKKEKKLSDKQFEVLMEIYNNSKNV